MSLYYQIYNGTPTNCKTQFYNFLESHDCTITAGSAAWDILTIKENVSSSDLYNNQSGTSSVPWVFLLCDTAGYEVAICLRNNFNPNVFSLNYEPCILGINEYNNQFTSFKTNSGSSNWTTSYFADRAQQGTFTNYKLTNMISFNTSNQTQRIAKDLFVNVNNLSANALQVFFDGSSYYIYCGCNVYYRPAIADYDTVEEIKLLSA